MRIKQGQEGSTHLRFVRSSVRSSVGSSVRSSEEKVEFVPVIRVNEVKETPLNSICVHEFDGKLPKIPIKSRTPNEKQALFSIFGNKIKILPISNSSIIRNMETIMNEMSTPQNYLVTDGIYADDILAEIIDIIIHKDTDIIPIFLEQMLDICTGACPSGRVVRLYQILLALKD
jgi:hypothetical protein